MKMSVFFVDGLDRCRRRGHAAVVQLNAGFHRRIYSWRERMWPGIIGPSVGALSVLSLLPFFQHFRDDSPYHLAGVAALQEAMPAELSRKTVTGSRPGGLLALTRKSLFPTSSNRQRARRLA